MRSGLRQHPLPHPQTGRAARLISLAGALCVWAVACGDTPGSGGDGDAGAGRDIGGLQQRDTRGGDDTPPADASDVDAGGADGDDEDGSGAVRDSGIDAPDIAGDVVPDADAEDADVAADLDADVAADAVDADVPTDTAPDVLADLGPDVAPDVASDVAADTSPDAAADIAPDVAADISVDAPPDVAADVSSDTSPDVGPDVPPACAVTPTRFITNFDSDDVMDVFRDAGLSITNPLSVNATHFAGTGDVVAVDAAYLSASATPAVIRDFLERGGSVVLFATSISTSCNRIQAEALDGLPISLSCERQVVGPPASLGRHPLTASMSPGQFLSAFSAEVVGGTALAIASDRRAIASVVEVGCGRLVVVGASDMGEDPAWPTSRQFWTNVRDWMAAPR